MQPPRNTDDDLARLTERVADRLRHLAPARIAPLEAQVRPLLHRLARLAAAAEGIDEQPLHLPRSRAWGDVIDVLGAALAEGLARRPDPALAARGHEVLTQLRRVLP